MEGIEEPVTRDLLAVLRRAVVEHVRAEPRRTYPPLVHVGWPGGREEVFPAAPAERLDHALRCDVVAALVSRARSRPPVVGAVPLVWLTRPGPLVAGDLDQEWVAPVRSAAAEAGLALTLVVVTKRGWHDPRSGVRREWRRVRPPPP